MTHFLSQLDASRGAEGVETLLQTTLHVCGGVNVSLQRQPVPRLSGCPGFGSASSRGWGGLTQATSHARQSWGQLVAVVPRC